MSTDTNSTVVVRKVGKDKYTFPRRVTIETIFGCNAKCLMCPIDKPSSRKKGIMPLDMFTNIINSLVPYKENFQMMDLYGLGEPLLDPYIFERIRYVKDKGFCNLAISTNADLLKGDKQRLLLESGIDTILFSIDGVTKETHESIRRGTDFDGVVDNCKSIIRMRDEGDYKTRFVIRFIRQDKNKNEWESYKQHWLKIISKNRRDFITAFDVHSWGGEVFAKNSILKADGYNETIEKKPCWIIFEVLYILVDGTVPLCNEDWHNASYSFGNASVNSAIEIFNCKEFNNIRDIHIKGEKRKMNICRDCTLLYSLAKKEIV